MCFKCVRSIWVEKLNKGANERNVNSSSNWNWALERRTTNYDLDLHIWSHQKSRALTNKQTEVLQLKQAKLSANNFKLEFEIFIIFNKSFVFPRSFMLRKLISNSNCSNLKKRFNIICRKKCFFCKIMGK